jgi:hypothetical protein
VCGEQGAGYTFQPMASNDPTETGGLFIGRRPGTAPLRYKKRPERPRGMRRRLDAVLAGAILVVETLLCATLWGPQPAAWLWIGSRIFHETDSIGLAILTAFAGMLVTILGTLGIAMRLDRAWKIVRRASGHEQKKGVLEAIFVISMALAGIAFVIWFLVIQGPGSDIAPR